MDTRKPTYEERTLPLDQALRAAIAEHGTNLPPEEILATLLGISQERASANEMKGNPFASGIEYTLRGFSATFLLGIYPDLADEYIGSKLENGYVRLRDACAAHEPPLAFMPA